MLFIDDLDIEGKKLLIRVDYNVPVKNGVITDDTRIKGSLETLRYAIEKGAAIILCAHFGKPKGQVVPELSLKLPAEHLGKLLGQEVKMAPDCIGTEVEKMAAALAPGEIMMLENLRFHAGETANDDAFSAELGKLADIYVCDAFGVSHRAHASVVGVTQYYDQCCGGFLLKKEWEYLGEALQTPERPYVAISGGSKVSSKLGVLKNLLNKVDELIIGGAMANTFLLAQGYEVGSSLVEPDLVDDAKAIMERAKDKGVTIHLPVDVVLGKSLDDQKAADTRSCDAIPSDLMVLDVGPESIKRYEHVLERCKTIMWNGPLGAFENPAFAEGSYAIARKAASLDDALTIVGGGDTDAVIHTVGLESKFSFISTGGGSFLEFIEGKELPAFKALNEKAK